MCLLKPMMRLRKKYVHVIVVHTTPEKKQHTHRPTTNVHSTSFIIQTAKNTRITD